MPADFFAGAGHEIYVLGRSVRPQVPARFEHGRQAGAAIEVVAADAIAQPPESLVPTGDDYPSAGADPTLGQLLGREPRFNPHLFPFEGMAVFEPPGRALGGDVLGAGGEYARAETVSRHDLDRAFPECPRVQAAQGLHSDFAVGFNALDDEGDLVLVGDGGHRLIVALALDVDDDVVGRVLPDGVADGGGELGDEGIHSGFRTRRRVRGDQLLDKAVEAFGINGHRVILLPERPDLADTKTPCRIQ